MHGTPTIPIITGTTASGKTALSLAFAKLSQIQGRAPIEIINADSLLVYRGFDIGTAKPILQERADTPHHLIDICSPEEDYSAAQFVRDCERLLLEIQERGAQPVIVGGTGFYIKALLFGLWEAPPTDAKYRAQLASRSPQELHHELNKIDAISARKIGPQDRYRLMRALEIHAISGEKPSDLQAASLKREADPRFGLLITELPISELDALISTRTHAMLQAGLIEETERLARSHNTARALQSIGYAQTLVYLGLATPPSGRKIAPGIQGLEQEINLATRQLAKSQRTWYRGQFLPRLPETHVAVGHPIQDRTRLLETLARWRSHP